MRYLIKHRRGLTRENKIALTFDDGPSNWTPKFLDKLDELNIKATFFVIPENVYALPKVAKDILTRGHEVGAHVAQPEQFNIFKAVFKKVKYKDIDYSVKAIVDICDVEPVFFLPSPEMALNRGLEQALKKRGLIPVLASAYSRVTKTNEQRFNDITQNLKGDDIILLHDGHDLYRDSPRPKGDLEILDKIVSEAIKRNLDFVRVSQLIKEWPYK